MTTQAMSLELSVHTYGTKRSKMHNKAAVAISYDFNNKGNYDVYEYTPGSGWAWEDGWDTHSTLDALLSQFGWNEQQVNGLLNNIMKCVEPGSQYSSNYRINMHLPALYQD